MKGLQLAGSLALATMFCAALLICRMGYTGNARFIFLGFNLVLAWIPMAVSMLMLPMQNKWQHKLLFWPMFATWLAFFPNSPYIITDLLHLKHRADAPFWFDCLMISSFAWVGLLLGLLSLRNIHLLLGRLYNKTFALVTVLISSLLCGYGIYLGRFLRWNSWDIINNPTELMSDVLVRFIHPFTYPRAHLMAIVGAGLIITSYMVIQQLSEQEKISNPKN